MYSTVQNNTKFYFIKKDNFIFIKYFGLLLIPKLKNKKT